MEPPPEPTESTSTIDNDVHCPTTMPRVRRNNAPSLTSATSSDVPPRSHVTTLRSPRAALSERAAAPPAAGPDCARPIGVRRAASTVVTPPPECVSTTGGTRPSAWSCSANVLNQSSDPSTYALSSANCVRSYSRMTGASSAPHTTRRFGQREAIAARAASSLIGLRNDQRNDTTIVSMCSRSTRPATDSITFAGSTSVSTMPSRLTRSSIPTMQVRSTSDGGGTSQPFSLTRLPRARGTRSSKPLVVTRPRRRPVRVASTLVTTVVPRPKRPRRGSNPRRSVPKRTAT